MEHILEKISYNLDQRKQCGHWVTFLDLICMINKRKIIFQIADCSLRRSGAFKSLLENVIDKQYELLFVIYSTLSHLFIYFLIDKVFE